MPKPVQMMLMGQVKDGQVHHCSCLELVDLVPGGSLDAVFTDPPYPKAFLPCWEELYAFAAHALRPGGLLLAMHGQLLMPEVLSILNTAPLRYRCQVAMLWRKPRTHLHAAKISNGWKGLLAFTRAGGHPKHYSEDAFQAGPFSPNAQEMHEWGQDQALMNAVAKEWLKPGWKVADPFCGAGSLVVAARNAGCEVVACDVDVVHVYTTREKLQWHGR